MADKNICERCKTKVFDIQYIRSNLKSKQRGRNIWVCLSCKEKENEI